MKKVFLVVLVVLGGWWLVGCAVVGPRGLAVKFEGPALVEKILGVGQVNSVSITNTTNFYIKLVALGKEVAIIGPGATAYSKRSFEFDYTEAPVTALVYANEGKGDSVIGIAGTVLQLRYGYPTSWVIRNADIRYVGFAPKFSHGQISTQSTQRQITVAVDAVDQKVDFPRLILKSTTALQIVNASIYDADVKINGQKIWKLKSGDIGYREYYYPYDYGQQMRIDVIFSDGNVFVGHWESYFYIGGNYNGPRAVQFVLTKETARR